MGAISVLVHAPVAPAEFATRRANVTAAKTPSANAPNAMALDLLAPAVTAERVFAMTPDTATVAITSVQHAAKQAIAPPIVAPTTSLCAITDTAIAAPVTNKPFNTS